MSNDHLNILARDEIAAEIFSKLTLPQKIDYVTNLQKHQLNEFLPLLLNQDYVSPFDFLVIQENLIKKAVSAQKDLSFIQYLANLSPNQPLQFILSENAADRIHDSLLRHAFLHPDPAIFPWVISHLHPSRIANVWLVLNQQNIETDKRFTLTQLSEWLILFTAHSPASTKIDTFRTAEKMMNWSLFEKIIEMLVDRYPSFVDHWDTPSNSLDLESQGNQFLIALVLNSIYRHLNVSNNPMPVKIKFIDLIFKHMHQFEGNVDEWMHSKLFSPVTFSSDLTTQQNAFLKCALAFLSDRKKNVFQTEKDHINETEYEFFMAWSEMLKTQEALKENGHSSIFTYNLQFDDPIRPDIIHDHLVFKSIEKPKNSHVIQRYLNLSKEKNLSKLKQQTIDAPFNDPTLQWLLAHSVVQKSFLEYGAKVIQDYNVTNSRIDILNLNHCAIDDEDDREMEDFLSDTDTESVLMAQFNTFSLWRAAPEFLLNYQANFQKNILHILFSQPLVLLTNQFQNMVIEMINQKPELLSSKDAFSKTPSETLNRNCQAFSSSANQAAEIQDIFDQFEKKIVAFSFKADKALFFKENEHLTQNLNKKNNLRI